MRVNPDRRLVARWCRRRAPVPVASSPTVSSLTVYSRRRRRRRARLSPARSRSTRARWRDSSRSKTTRPFADSLRRDREAAHGARGWSSPPPSATRSGGARGRRAPPRRPPRSPSRMPPRSNVPPGVSERRYWARAGDGGREQMATSRDTGDSRRVAASASAHRTRSTRSCGPRSPSRTRRRQDHRRPRAPRRRPAGRPRSPGCPSRCRCRASAMDDRGRSSTRAPRGSRPWSRDGPFRTRAQVRS